MIEIISPYIGMGMLVLFVTFLLVVSHYSEKEKKHSHKSLPNHKK